MNEGALLLLELALMFLLLWAAWRHSGDKHKQNLGFFAFHESLAPEQPNKQDSQKMVRV